MTYERVLWRILRGNLYMKDIEITEPVNDPETDRPIYKNVFAIFAHGQEIINKIKKISESLGGTLYTVDDSADKRRSSLMEATTRLKELKNVCCRFYFILFYFILDSLLTLFL
jgi:V-type H+-transporting ATPase subunit a